MDGFQSRRVPGPRLATEPSNVSCFSPSRFSAFHHAALNGNTELISLLVEAQAAVDIKDNKGKLGRGARRTPVERENR